MFRGPAGPSIKIPFLKTASPNDGEWKGTYVEVVYSSPPQKKHIFKESYDLLETKMLKYSNYPTSYPSDFPPKLKKYWNHNLEYSSTPIQSGWIQYYHDQSIQRKRQNNSTRKN